MDNLLYIIFEKKTGTNSAEKWWTEAAAACGFDTSILYADSLGTMALPAGEMLVIDRKGNILPWPDAVIMRCYDRYLSLAFERVGIPVINRWKAMELCRDKFLCAAALGTAGIPVPLTIQATGTPYSALARHIDAPFIVKPREGSKGEGVELAKADTGLNLKKDFIAQSYIGDRPGTDIRVWVVGGKAIDGIVRSNPGKTASNFAAGGHPEPLRGNARKRAFVLAEQAANACGLFFAGVDILYGPGEDNFTVCEVNGNAGFRTLTPTRGRRLVKTVVTGIAKSL